MEQANFSELREKINDWDIQAEALLIQKIRLFSVNYNEDFQSLCQNFTNFSNHISSTEVEHLRAINQLKSISNEKFIEQSLQNYEQNQPENIINEEIIMNPSEKMKKSLEISIQNIESFPKKRKKEAIEDDSASLASSKIIIEKETKGLKIPYIIGTEMFNAEKAIGLDVVDEEEDNEDNENNPGVLENVYISPKEKAKWDRIQKEKEEKERRKKSKNQKNQTKNFEEPEIKVPIENEIEQPKQEEEKEKNSNSNQNSSEIKVISNKGGSVPPPPPPPPPVIMPPPGQKKEATKSKVQPPQIKQELKLPDQENPEKNGEQNVLQPEQIQPQSKPVEKKRMDFQTQLRMMMQNRGNNNQNNNENKENKENNNNENKENKENNMMNPIITTADNKNPLAPVIRDKNFVPNKQNVKVNAFIGGRIDDDDDGEEEDIDITNSIFKKNKNKIIQPPIIKDENNKENLKIQEESKINEQKQEEIISQQKKILTESQFIQIKQNPNLIKAGKRMKDLFGSDDEEEEENPKNIVDKTKDLTNKLNNFGIETNQIKEEPKKEETKKEEQKKEEPKVKPKS